MRIVAVRREPVARILSVIYAVFGLYAFLLFAFTNAQTLTLPLGFVVTVIHFNINFNLPRPTGLALGALYLALTILLYALTGWITGATGALCFNWVAKWMGGIDAKFVETVDDAPPSPKL